MKTISELNNTKWYRFLKVIYILSFIIIFGFSLWIILNEYPFHINAKKSYAKCDNGTIINFADKFKDIDSLSDAASLECDYDKFVANSEYWDTMFRLYCLTNKEIGEKIKMVYSAYEDIDTEQLGAKARQKLEKENKILLYSTDPTIISLKKIVIPAEKNYSFVIACSRNWLRILEYSILSFLILAVVFEFIKRIFYYIVLGTIKPKK